MSESVSQSVTRSPIELSAGQLKKSDKSKEKKVIVTLTLMASQHNIVIKHAFGLADSITVSIHEGDVFLLF